MRHRKYTLDKFIEDDEIRVRETNISSEQLDNQIQQILDKTEYVATSIETNLISYINDLNKFQDGVDKRWKEHGINYDEIMKVASTLKAADKRMDDIIKNLQEMDRLNNIQEQLISYLQEIK